jgi:hypothetical protein
MVWLVFVINFILWAIAFTVGYSRIIQRHRKKIHDTPPKPALSYYRIAKLEIELFGETKPNHDSHMPPWCKSEAEIWGIDETGHLKNGTCNLNSTMGPVCSKWTHQRRRSGVVTPATRAVMYGYGLYGCDEDGQPW